MKKKIMIINILIIAIFMITGKSFAAIEIKPSATADSKGVMVNTSVTNSYSLCQNMTQKRESLYGATVLPHLSTNSDWGAVSYLSNSIYGTNSVGKNTGVEVTIGGINYYSTNGNVTGVMNWGRNYYNARIYTQTAGLIQAYVTNNTGSTAIDNVTELEIAAKNNSRFVEVIKTSKSDFTVKNTLGQALAETSGYNWGQWRSIAEQTNNPISVRQGLFGFVVGHFYGGDTYITAGDARSIATFRPVIWNK